MNRPIAFLISSVMFLTTLSVQANEDPTGRNAAFEFCRTLDFNSYIQLCRQEVHGARYFTVEALDVCKGVHFDRNKVDCIKAIANKVYLSAELSICSGETFDTHKLECLRTSGQYSDPGSQCRVDIPSVRAQLNMTLHQLRSHNYVAADRGLVNLIYYFDSIR